jgi:hypothetical protein
VTHVGEEERFGGACLLRTLPALFEIDICGFEFSPFVGEFDLPLASAFALVKQREEQCGRYDSEQHDH